MKMLEAASASTNINHTHGMSCPVALTLMGLVRPHAACPHSPTAAFHFRSSAKLFSPLVEPAATTGVSQECFVCLNSDPPPPQLEVLGNPPARHRAYNRALGQRPQDLPPLSLNASEEQGAQRQRPLRFQQMLFFSPTVGLLPIRSDQFVGAVASSAGSFALR